MEDEISTDICFRPSKRKQTKFLRKHDGVVSKEINSGQFPYNDQGSVVRNIRRRKVCLIVWCSFLRTKELNPQRLHDCCPIPYSVGDTCPSSRRCSLHSHTQSRRQQQTEMTMITPPISPFARRITYRMQSQDVRKYLIADAVRRARRAAVRAGGEYVRTLTPPKRIKRWCVLRSPHVNKTSMEHFWMHTHTRILQWDANVNVDRAAPFVIARNLPPIVATRVQEDMPGLMALRSVWEVLHPPKVKEEEEEQGENSSSEGGLQQQEQQEQN